mmetsp:Transcript_15659/g.39473  ORF Transcript_15659/g.39473 Transcript_15659/m.39473 type:complete len:249 (-) Transcript_15659:455-1201(-)
MHVWHGSRSQTCTLGLDLGARHARLAWISEPGPAVPAACTVLFGASAGPQLAARFTAFRSRRARCEYQAGEPVASTGRKTSLRTGQTAGEIVSRLPSSPWRPSSSRPRDGVRPRSRPSPHQNHPRPSPFQFLLNSIHQILLRLRSHRRPSRALCALRFAKGHSVPYHVPAQGLAPLLGRRPRLHRTCRGQQASCSLPHRSRCLRPADGATRRARVPSQHRRHQDLLLSRLAPVRLWRPLRSCPRWHAL